MNVIHLFDVSLTDRLTINEQSPKVETIKDCVFRLAYAHSLCSTGSYQSIKMTWALPNCTGKHHDCQPCKRLRIRGKFWVTFGPTEMVQ